MRQFPEFLVGPERSSSVAAVEPEVVSNLIPDEMIRQARDQIEADLSAVLLARVQSASPAFFEGLVVKLLTAMGYGGSVTDAGRALGRSGDEGVDGVIDQDALGLERIYVQAKRYGDGNAVGAGAIRDFFGALDQVKAGKGLFVTTSYYTTAARQTADGLSKRIVLIDGLQLAALLIRYDVGCRIEETVSIKRLDEDFFEA
ncbi:restriction endonuclease [Sphingomonas arantia]|uniref:restriction endonuclease n=1 Tax=Sphingomonas arantia TaxID=1460676 RepID=UPI0036D347DE